MSMVGRDPTPDMHPDTLAALSALMVAQAQESIYQKCSIGMCLFTSQSLIFSNNDYSYV